MSLVRPHFIVNFLFSVKIVMVSLMDPMSCGTYFLFCNHVLPPVHINELHFV
jgi:hypothetical protein